MVPYPSGSANVHDVPSGDIAPVSAAPCGVVTCRAVILPCATVIVTGAVGGSPPVPNTGSAVTTTGPATVGVAAAVPGQGAPTGAGNAGTVTGADRVVEAAVGSGPAAPVNDAIDRTEPEQPASRTAAAITAAGHPIRRTATHPNPPRPLPVPTPTPGIQGCPDPSADRGGIAAYRRRLHIPGNEVPGPNPAAPTMPHQSHSPMGNRGHRGGGRTLRRSLVRGIGVPAARSWRSGNPSGGPSVRLPARGRCGGGAGRAGR